jgi:mannan endo-1,4-beta-mannosidase
MIQNVITPLQGEFGSQFGGVMGWEFSFDQGGAWANGIAQALDQKNGCPARPYTVVAGDTLYLIAQRFLGDGTRWEEITNADGTSIDPQNLQIGQVVRIPGRPYTVVAGDTLYLIAQRFLGDGTRWKEITNPDGTSIDPQTLQIGQVVCLPESKGSKTLNFLGSISGSQTVAGQHNREPNSEPATWTNWIHDTTGKFPGLWSGDFLYEQDNIDNRGTMIEEAKNQWKQGALINLMYHAAPPDLGEPCGWDPGVINHSLSGDQWNELVTDGSDLNNKWKARLDVISVFLQDLKDNGVEVLWRPFHEMNKSMDPNQNPFWWNGRPGPNGSARLYQITRDYMVGSKGLTNLIWIWDVQDVDFNWADYNPGDGYWDVLAMDMYGDGYTTQKYETALQLAGQKPIAIGECEILPTVGELVAQPRWTFFMAWAELVKANSVQQIQDLYNAANVIIRDRMPGWG